MPEPSAVGKFFTNLADLASSVMNEVEVKLGIPKDSLVPLLDADDWSFVIKSHTLFEGAVSLLLTANTDPRLHHLFDRMRLGDRSSGRLAFAKSLNLLDDADVSLIIAVAKLRHPLAHDPRHLSFTFAGHLAQLDNSKRNELLGAIFRSGKIPSPVSTQAIKFAVAAYGFLIVGKAIVAAEKQASPPPPAGT